MQLLYPLQLHYNNSISEEITNSSISEENKLNDNNKLNVTNKNNYNNSFFEIQKCQIKDVTENKLGEE